MARFNSKQFMLNLSTTHAEDLCNFASYNAYLTGSNKIFYLHEYFKTAVWREVEASGFATDSTYQIPFRPASQLKLIHLTRMANVTADQHAHYAQHADPLTCTLRSDLESFAPSHRWRSSTQQYLRCRHAE